MKKSLLSLLLFTVASVPVLAQTPEPFEGCPGVSVAITRPGFNLTLVPHQIYLIDDTTGAVQPSGIPINLQINAFGLNGVDGFLYGMHQTYNVANPFLTRVGKNGRWEIVGTIPAPDAGRFKTGIINTAAGTMDDKDNYYFTAATINLQNILLPPELYSGKIEKISELRSGDRPLTVQYKKISTGTCTDELLLALANPLSGLLQDIAFNPGDNNIYTYLPGPNNGPGKIAKYNPTLSTPILICIDPPQPNPATADLSGLFVSADSSLYILTIDGKYYWSDPQTGVIQEVAQTTLPLLSGNLRGDMASCVGKKRMQPFEDCPGVTVAVTRPGINSTGGPHQIYRVRSSTGEIRPLGHPINLQINGFGLNNKDGFLYGMHEVSDIFAPTLARVDRNGDYVDLNTIPGPPAGPGNARIINTAAATMDGADNYYFTAVVVDTFGIPELPRLYLGMIKNVSKLEPGEEIRVKYDRILLGDCLDEILQSISNPANGLLQDIAYNPKDGRIYTYIQRNASPSAGKLASFKLSGRVLVMDCKDRQGNPATQDLSGMHSNNDGEIFLLTIDGKYYRANTNNGAITEVAQTTLPLLANNLRGDMASCVRQGRGHGDHENGHDDDDDDYWGRLSDESGRSLRVGPNPVTGDEIVLYVESDETGGADMRIVDANGNARQNRKLQLAKGSNQVRILVRDLQRGVFAMVLTYPNGKVSTVKFIRM